MWSFLTRILGKREQVLISKKRTTSMKRRLSSTDKIVNAMRAVTESRLKGPESDPRRPRYPRVYARKAASAASALVQQRMSQEKRHLLLQYLRINRGRRGDTAHLMRNDAEQLLADNAAMSLLCKQPTWTLKVLEHLRKLEAHALCWATRNLLMEELVKALEEGKTSLDTWSLEKLVMRKAF